MGPKADLLAGQATNAKHAIDKAPVRIAKSL